MLTWTCKPFDALTTHELYELLRLRSEVFVVEQACAFQDLDGSDARAWHLMGRDAPGQLVAYSRLFGAGVKYAEASIGRVVSAPSTRGQGLGQVLMAQSIAHCAQYFAGVPVRIGAQARLQRFYEGFGFVLASDIYDEDGIDHVEMVRPAGGSL